MLRSLLLPLLVTATVAAPPEVSTTTDDAKGTVTVKFDGKPFTTLVYRGHPKPVLHPVIGPGDTLMLRQWPVAEAAPGEEKDHPHHKGIWFTHGDVNGVDFWKEAKDAGRIVVTEIPDTQALRNGTAVIRTVEDWLAPSGNRICSGATTITCGLDGTARFIDYAITLTAADGPVTFGDTKEGTMGLRSHPALNLKGEVAKGQCANSEGQSGPAIWGKRARWVDYWAPVGGKVVGIACFDHPDNLRHPTTWHARDYGLIAANPFGLHDFLKQPAGSGNHVIPKGESLTLRYRWLFHEGDPGTAEIEKRWKQWAAPAAR